jgi:hypothetical protein
LILQWEISPTNTLELYKVIYARGNELPPSGRPENGVESLLWPPKEPTEHEEWFIFLLEDPDVYAYIFICVTAESNAHGFILIEFFVQGTRPSIPTGLAIRCVLRVTHE